MAGTSAVVAGAVEAATDRSLGAGVAVATAASSQTSFGIARRLLADPFAALEPERRRRVLAGPAGRAAPWLEGEYEPEAANLVESLSELITRLASERGGLLLAIDDAQVADPGSLRLLEVLHARMGDVPLAIVAGLQRRGITRDAALDRLLALPRATRVTLPPLSERGVARFVAQRLGKADDLLARTAHEVTAGSPWLLDALLARIEGGSFAALDRDSLLADVPPIVSGRVGVELGRLDPDTVAVAEALAVIGEPCALHLAANAAELDLDAAGAGADALAAAHLSTPGEPLAFLQPLIGAAVAARIAPFARAAMHRRVAEALAASGAAPELLAPHLLHTPAAGDPRTVETLRAAARSAAEADRRDHAAELLRRAFADPERRRGEPRTRRARPRRRRRGRRAEHPAARGGPGPLRRRRARAPARHARAPAPYPGRLPGGGGRGRSGARGPRGRPARRAAGRRERGRGGAPPAPGAGGDAGGDALLGGRPRGRAARGPGALRLALGVVRRVRRARRDRRAPRGLRTAGEPPRRRLPREHLQLRPHRPDEHRRPRARRGHGDRGDGEGERAPPADRPRPRPARPRPGALPAGPHRRGARRRRGFAAPPPRGLDASRRLRRRPPGRDQGRARRARPRPRSARDRP